MEGLSEYDQEALQILSGFEDRAGYLKIQQRVRRRSRTASPIPPAGQLAWNSELFMGFGSEGRRGESRPIPHARDALLADGDGRVFRLREYYEDARTGAGYRDLPNTVPTGVAVFKNDFHTLRRFAERANNIVHWSVFDRGGHFATMDAPDLLIGDLREFFRRFR